MGRSDAERVIRALEGFAAAGRGDVKARYRLRIDNRGQAY
jgi:hypothetical protein